MKATGTKVASQGKINYVTYDIDNVIDNTQNPTKYQIGIGVNIKPLTSKVQTTIKKRITIHMEKSICLKVGTKMKITKEKK